MEKEGSEIIQKLHSQTIFKGLFSKLRSTPEHWSDVINEIETLLHSTIIRQYTLDSITSNWFQPLLERYLKFL